MKHQQAKAEEQYKIAQSIEPESEEVVLNLARVYVESGDIDRAVKLIEAVPEAIARRAWSSRWARRTTS